MKDYKKILEGVVDIINNTEKSDIGFANICSYIGENCPELKESKDERIRQKLIEAVKGDMVVGGTKDKQLAIDWLEKQGEQKPVFEMKTPEESLGIDSDTYNKIVDECIYGEQKPAWSEEDEHRFKDAIYFLDTAKKHYASTVELDACIDWFKSLKDRIQPQTTWKPTKEQMDALLFVVQHYTPNVTNKLAWDSIKILELMYYEIKH